MPEHTMLLVRKCRRPNLVVPYCLPGQVAKDKNTSLETAVLFNGYAPQGKIRGRDLRVHLLQSI